MSAPTPKREGQYGEGNRLRSHGNRHLRGWSWGKVRLTQSEHCLKESEGISQRTYMKDPWTWTTVMGLIMELGSGLGGEGTEGEKVG